MGWSLLTWTTFNDDIAILVKFTFAKWFARHHRVRRWLFRQSVSKQDFLFGRQCVLRTRATWTFSPLMGLLAPFIVLTTWVSGTTGYYKKAASALEIKHGALEGSTDHAPTEIGLSLLFSVVVQLWLQLHALNDLSATTSAVQQDQAVVRGELVELATLISCGVVLKVSCLLCMLGSIVKNRFDRSIWVLAVALSSADVLRFFQLLIFAAAQTSRNSSTISKTAIDAEPWEAVLESAWRFSYQAALCWSFISVTLVACIVLLKHFLQGRSPNTQNSTTSASIEVDRQSMSMSKVDVDKMFDCRCRRVWSNRHLWGGLRRF